MNQLSHRIATLDANEAVASVAYRLSEVIAIYPITPSSPMAESSDEYSAAKKPNLWGQVPRVVQLQSEGGVAGAMHGSLLSGSMTTSFTASQGLLLMIPNMYKIAGELMPCVLHVTARALATHALSIFGDHSDVMACRATGFAMLCSGSGQEAGDFALISHAATLKASVPFMHFFDGFRTSHEVSKIALLDDAVLRAMVDEADIARFKSRALTPNAPSIRGTAQNPDVYFQGREACNAHYDALPGIVQGCMDRFATLTGRKYSLYDYHGAPDADRVIVVMGSGAETIEETVDALNERGAKLGVLKVRLFLPFLAPDFLKALPASVKSVAVLDRTKEPGSLGEPLFQTVLTAFVESGKALPRLIGGRYGLGSKEFTPAMVKAVFDELSKPEPKRRFTVGIIDDVTGTSLAFDPAFDIEKPDVVRAVFVGLGADGTVGANKNSIKIIGEQTDNYAQGYFVYDSKKSGAMTVSHLRFGPRPIRSQYLITGANFVACSQYSFIGRQPVLEFAMPGATVLLNSPFGAADTWSRFPREWQETILAKKLKVFVIDASKVAAESGMKGRTNTVMQTCFFALSGVLPREDAIKQIKKSIEKTYGRKGEHIVKMNFQAVDNALAGLAEIVPPAAASVESVYTASPEYPGASDFFKRVSAKIIAGQGDLLPVSALPPDGGWPTGTACHEKRNLAAEIPAWDPSICIQCNKCALVCPHAAIRPKFYPEAELAGAPATFKSTTFKSRDNPGMLYTLQVAAEDCTGCSLCVQVCPAKDKSNPRHKAIDMVPQEPLVAAERENFDFFLKLPEPDRAKLTGDVKGSQFMQPLMEFSGACAGCGETPYIKLLTQLFGDRLMISNATGCSSIYGGNLPTTPYTTNKDGRGPAWANSLFEDNAEFGLGMRLAADQQADLALLRLRKLAPQLGEETVRALVESDQHTDAGIAAQRERVAALRETLAKLGTPEAEALSKCADSLVKRSVWIVGGDGWAYDIGYGGLDHVLASGANIKVLVLDTEVYSNTGGQASKSTPMGAVAKFASAGKPAPKKDLALMAMQYGNVYVARVAFGAKDVQTLNALREADAHDGPALILAYSHCIAHGYALQNGLEQQKLAVDTGYWPLLRYDPKLAEKGENPLKLDSPAPKAPLAKFTANETRFRILENIAPERAKILLGHAQEKLNERYANYERLAAPYAPKPAPAGDAPASSTPHTPNA